MKWVIPVGMSAVLLAVAGPVRAQDALLESCAGVTIVSPQGQVPSEVQDQFRYLCGQVVTVITTLQPTVGVAFSGGAHTLGTATTIGRRLGLPRVSVTARVNGALVDAPDLLDGYLPRFDENDRLTPMGTTRLPVIALQGDVVLGLLNGVSVGPVAGGMGAVDLLGSLSFIPAVDAVGLSESILNVGVGARLGILRQGLILPGVSVSAMYRTMLGDVTFGELGPDPNTGDPAEFAAGLSTWSFRGGVSKGILALDLAAGAGWDIYTSDVSFDWRLRCPPEVCDQERVVATDGGVSGRLRTSAWNVFGNVGVNLLLLRLVAEVGYQQPATVVDAAALQRAGLPAQAPAVEDLGGGRFFLGLGARLTL
jgi:hypothetical protein